MGVDCALGVPLGFASLTTGGENTTAVEEITAVDDRPGVGVATVAGTGAPMTDAPAGIRGARDLDFAVGRRTGAKARAADHPAQKKAADEDTKNRNAVVEKGRKSDIQLTSSGELWRTDGDTG